MTDMLITITVGVVLYVLFLRRLWAWSAKRIARKVWTDRIFYLVCIVVSLTKEEPSNFFLGLFSVVLVVNMLYYNPYRLHRLHLAEKEALANE